MSLPELDDYRFVPMHEQFAIAMDKRSVTVIALVHGLSRGHVQVIKRKFSKSGKLPNS